MLDIRNTRITALENEINGLCRSQGIAERYPRLDAAPAQWPPTQPGHVLAEDALRASEAFNRSIIESSVDCIKVLDLEGKLLDMPNGRRVLGIDCQAFLNTSWLALWSGIYRQAAQAAITAAAQGRSHSFVGLFQTAPGEPRWWDVVVSPILDAAGKPARLLVMSRDITERKQAADALHQRTAQFKTLIDEAPLGIYLIDANFRIQHINRKALPVFGDIPNLIGRNLAEVCHIVWPTAKADEAIGQFRRTLETGESFHVDELIEERADRKQLEYYEWQISRIELPDSSYGVVCFFRDISQRVLAQHKIRLSESRLRALVTASSDVVYRMSPDWREMHQLDGRNFIADSLEGNDNWLQDYIHPDDQASVLAAIHEAIRTKGLFEMEHPVQRVDGSIGWTFSHAVPMLGAQGEIVEWFGTAKDVTEHKRAEQALRESEERYRTLFDSIDEGFCVIEVMFDAASKPVDYRFIEVNPSFEKQTGLISATGKRMREFVPNLDESWFEIYGKVVLTGEPIRFENEATEMNHNWFDVYAFRIGDAAGCKVAVLFTNITQRKQAQQQLLALTQTLADQDRRKDEFLAMLGHELRNPLAPISNAMHLLRQQKGENPIQRQARQVIERQTEQLTCLVDDLLEVSRITTGQVQLRREHIAMAGIIERAVETAQPLIFQRRHTLAVTLAPQPLWLHADASRLEQVVVNLLNNAAKYTEHGGCIDLSVEQDNEFAVLRLRDTGFGIAPELLPHIFELFTQAARSLDRSEGGLGIGLCLVQRLVELHGGSVSVQSTLGHGSEFTVRLPLAQTEVAPPKPEPTSAVPVAAPAAPLATARRILVVDDNIDAAETLKMMLEASSHAVAMAHEGLSALETARTWRPDVVFLDIGLPGLSGYEVARQIRLIDMLKSVVLVALTGYGQASDRQLALEAGFDHHLIKPANFRMLEKILDPVAAGQM